MVRIPGFHPGDPGSIPGRGKKIFNFASRTHSHIRIICELGLVQWLEFAVANGEARVRFSDSAMTAAADIILLESSWRDVSPAVPALIFILAYARMRVRVRERARECIKY